MLNIFKPICRSQLFPLQYDHQPHQPQCHRLQPRMLREHDRNISNKRNVSHNTANHIISSIQIILAPSVQFRIISRIIISLGQQFKRLRSLFLVSNPKFSLSPNPHSFVGRRATYALVSFTTCCCPLPPPPNRLTTLCTIGISLPLTLYTITSPTLTSGLRFQSSKMSPRWNAGSMLPESTTTMGDGESASTESPFHIMNAVVIMSAKLSICVSARRGEPRVESIVCCCW